MEGGVASRKLGSPEGHSPSAKLAAEPRKKKRCGWNSVARDVQFFRHFGLFKKRLVFAAPFAGKSAGKMSD